MTNARIKDSHELSQHDIILESGYCKLVQEKVTPAASLRRKAAVELYTFRDNDRFEMGVAWSFEGDQVLVLTW